MCGREGEEWLQCKLVTKHISVNYLGVYCYIWLHLLYITWIWYCGACCASTTTVGRSTCSSIILLGAPAVFEGIDDFVCPWSIPLRFLSCFWNIWLMNGQNDEKVTISKCYNMSGPFQNLSFFYLLTRNGISSDIPYFFFCNTI